MTTIPAAKRRNLFYTVALLVQDVHGVKSLAAKRVLFVCSGNIDRSPTAEALLRMKEGFEVKSAGTWAGAQTAVSKELIDWADVIFAMEEHHKDALIGIDRNAEAKIIVLGVDDHYLKGDPELTRVLKGKLSEYLGEIFSRAAKEKKSRTG